MFHPGHPFFIQINALFYRFLTFQNEIKKILNSPIKLSVNYDMSN